MFQGSFSLAGVGKDGLLLLSWERKYGKISKREFFWRVFMKTYTAKVFDKTKYALGEGPYYDPRFKRFSWVDILGNRLWTLSSDGEKRDFESV